MTNETDGNARHPALSPQERRTVTRAIRCLEAAYSVKWQAIAGPQDARDYLKRTGRYCSLLAGSAAHRERYTRTFCDFISRIWRNHLKSFYHRRNGQLQPSSQ